MHDRRVWVDPGATPPIESRHLELFCDEHAKQLALLLR